MYRCKCCGKKCDSSLCKECYKPFDKNEYEKSFAFTDEIPEKSQFENCTVLDFFKTNLEVVDFSGFKRLEKLRLSHCEKLTSVTLQNIPTLKSLDLSGCRLLEKLDITGTSNIIALDASLCSKLKMFYGNLPKCEYFSICETQFSKIPYLPSVKYLDIRAAPIKSLDNLRKCPHLQFFHAKDVYTDKELNLGEMPELTDLSSIKFSGTINLKGLPKTSKLATILCDKVLNIPSFLNCSISTTGGLSGNKFKFPVNSGDWHDAYRLIYGPWPSPPNDYEPRVKCDCVRPVPEGVDKKVAADIIAGVLFGSAIGDCVGLHTERDPMPYIMYVLDNPLDITWTHPLMTKRGLAFHRGSFTDDTALSLMFIRGVCDANGEIDPKRFGRLIHMWIDEGLSEHKDGYGIGQGPGTSCAVHSPNYDDDPIKASTDVWIKSGRFSAGNGAVMRTGAVGCYMFWDEKAVIENARMFAVVTHPHPWCVYGSIVLSLLIARFIQMRAGIRDEVDIDATIEECFSYVDDLSEEEIEIIRPFLYARDLADLELENPNIAPTLGTTGVGIWCLRKNVTFEQGIEAVIRAAGDTDTNGAVAGACLGAKFGYSMIPKDLIIFLWYRFSIRRELIPYLSLMGLEFDPNSEYYYHPGEDLTMRLRPKFPMK